MPLTTVAFSQSVDQAGAYAALNAVADQHVRVSGTDIQIPTLNQVIAVAGGAESAAAFRARLVSPSLRVRSNFQVTPLNVGAAAAVEPGSPAAAVDLRTSPLILTQGEQINFEILANPVAAQIQWGLVWLADAPPAPIGGPIFTVRATNTTTLVAQSWTNGALTFEEDLPRGRYQVVGMLAVSAGLVAARCVFVGGPWRPGCLGADALSDIGHPMFRYGGLGVWGEFEDIEPPTIDFLSVSADTSQEVWFDLIQVRPGPG